MMIFEKGIWVEVSPAKTGGQYIIWKGTVQVSTFLLELYGSSTYKLTTPSSGKSSATLPQSSEEDALEAVFRRSVGANYFLSD